ncbi:MAG: T9SS type A sorting domain-containing protein [Bacteroidia bacterium]
MKKALTIIAMILGSMAYGQQLSINDHNRLPYYNLGDIEVKFPLRVRNHDSVAHFLKVEITAETATGHTYQFCWDICYDIGHNYSLGGVNIPAGDSAGGFILYFRPNNYRGTSRFTITFFDENDPDIRVSHELTIYRYGTTSLEPKTKSTIRPPSPNPASAFTEVHFDLINNRQGHELRIYNLLGGEEKRIPVLPGTRSMRLNLADLRPGVYFLYLHAGDKPLSSQKLIIGR